MLHGVCLAYGRSVGLDTYGDLARGARVIELAEGADDFASWIREEGGIIAAQFSRAGLISTANHEG